MKSKILKIVSFSLALTLMSSTACFSAYASEIDWTTVGDDILAEAIKEGLAENQGDDTTEDDNNPTEETPVEETPTEENPVEETPTEEPTDGDNSTTENTTIYLGDTNSDGFVNVIDLINLKDAMINTKYADNIDLNQDGIIDTADILLLKKVILGLESPTEAPAPETPTGYHFEDGVLYFDDTPYSGTYTDDSNEDVLYQDGYAYTGILNTIGYVNGKMISGWAKSGDSKYYFDSSSHAYVTGLTSIDGTNYYFSSEGKLLTNCVIGQWVIGSDGTAVSSLKSKAQSVLSSYGNTPSSIYNNYMRVYHKYKHITDNITLSFSATNDTVTPQIVAYSPSSSSVNATGWACFALYTIDRSSASCYYLAALEDYLFREAGYTSRIVYGTQGSGVHYWNQVLVNGTWLNYDGCNSGRGGKTNSQLSAINSKYQWCGYIVPDADYNGCYYYKTTTDYNNGNYTYIVGDIYYTN